MTDSTRITSKTQQTQGGANVSVNKPVCELFTVKMVFMDKHKNYKKTNHDSSYQASR
jgi:hypothetical protein